MKARPLMQVVALAMPWKWEVMICHGGTREQVQAHIKEYAGIENDGVGDGAAGHCWVHANKPIVVWVEDIKDVPCLVHELMHAVFGMFEARGLKHTADSEEAYTYTVEDLLRRALTAKKWQRVSHRGTA